jgi:hypothetical protein
MTAQNSLPFKSVRHGYDPAEVEAHVAQLTRAAAEAQSRADGLEEQLNAVDPARGGTPMPPAEPTFHDFGKRIGRILAMAEEEAEEMRSAAITEVDARLTEADEVVERTRRDADSYSSDTRAAADEHATKIVEDAKRAADQMADEAQRMAIARSAEAEAVYEEQRARAAKAAADFEQTLAVRREKSETEFQERAALAEKELEAARNRVAKLRAEGDQLQAEAQRRAQQFKADAERRAEQIVGDAMERADRIRAESERELAAAGQRRDAINSQLSNVRQMLATLQGTAGSAVADEPEPESEAAEESR